ncbi:MAG: CDP-alcohol phosphatidyltransferase family protein [Bacteroidota bacterium]|jgi:CDP-diacylglycerol--serine O-phosphatidyltransferase
MKQLANFFTLLNLCFGCVAIVFTLQTGETIVNLESGEWKIYFPEKITWAAICIFSAAVVDFFDGFVARLLKADSEMGKQLDSLADVVSFGVAPGAIMYQLLRIAIAAEPSGMDQSSLYFLPVMLIPVAAAWRLARFNVDTTSSHHFKGLPAPAAGLFIATLPMISFYNLFDLQSILVNKWVLYTIAFFISYLMISSIRLINLKFKNFDWKENTSRYLLIIISVAAVLALGWIAGFVILITYILVSLLFKKELQ